ncbi:MAG: hypothetical protein NVSMB4_04220 [Acidimicrobiales bacterium]
MTFTPPWGRLPWRRQPSAVRHEAELLARIARLERDIVDHSWDDDSDYAPAAEDRDRNHGLHLYCGDF